MILELISLLLIAGVKAGKIVSVYTGLFPSRLPKSGRIMKNYKNDTGSYAIFLLAAFIAVVFLSSCSIGWGTTITAIDDGISSDMQALTEDLDGRVLNAILDNDTEGFKHLFCDELLNSEMDFKTS